MDNEQGFDILEFARTVLRRKWLFLLVSFLILGCGLYVITKVPVIYQSTGVILVEQQEIPTQWVNSTVTSYADERIKSISQRVLTTRNLGGIIEKYGVFRDLREHLSGEELADLARANFSIENQLATVRDRGSGNSVSATVSFSLSYRDPSPEIARDIATELVDLYLEENLMARSRAVTDTREFLETEADRLEGELANIEEKISKFKQENQGALPDQQDINIRTFERLEQQIADTDRDIRSLDEQRIILESSIDSARRLISAGRSTSGLAEEIDPTRERLIEAQSEYANLQTRYSDVHPDLIRLRREIDSLQSQLGADPGDTVASVNTEIVQDAGASSPDSVADAGLIRLNTELQSAIAEQASLRTLREELVAKLGRLEERLNKTPGVERDYRSLIRDHENIQEKYNDIRAKQNSARIAESLEEDQKAERFTLIESPRLPTNPHSPNYKQLIAALMGVSLLSGLGSVFALEKFDGRVRTISSVELATGLPVLATVGWIESAADRRRKILKLVLAASIIVALIAVSLYLVQYYKLTADDLNPKVIFSEIQEWLDGQEEPE